MKGKPDIGQFKSGKDATDFLESGAADVADRGGKTAVSVGKVPVETKANREQKMFRLPIDLVRELKREAYERSMKSGARVTETELVEQALRGFFKR